jgi:hypothetical protein
MLFNELDDARRTDSALHEIAYLIDCKRLSQLRISWGCANERDDREYCYADLPSLKEQWRQDTGDLYVGLRHWF